VALSILATVLPRGFLCLADLYSGHWIISIRHSSTYTRKITVFKKPRVFKNWVDERRKAMSPAQVLLEQARMEKSKQRLLSQKAATTSTSLAHPNILYDLQVLSTSTSDTQPSLLLTFGDAKYLFYSPSSTARLCTSNQIRIKKLSHIFLGELDESDGLPGIILSSFEAGNRHLGIIGPIGTGHLIASYRSYCRRWVLLIMEIKILSY
jgi:hypothetical protein